VSGTLNQTGPTNAGLTESSLQALRSNPAALLRGIADERQSSRSSALFQLIVTVTLYFSLVGTAGWAFNHGYWAALALVPITAGLLVRLFVLQHDCGHRSFFTSNKANDRVGSLLGTLTMTPYFAWRRFHAIHHATSGDLDRRGRGGEIWVMTVAEYTKASPWARFQYRLYRNPITLFVVGPLYIFGLVQRTFKDVPKTWKRERNNILFTNFGMLVLHGGWIMTMGWQSWLAVVFPTVWLASAAGIWLFYVQHQYEEAYYQPKEEWNYALAALDGSSHYRLPKILQWFSGNIGLHHLHHLDSKIPNYRLEKVLKAHPELKAGVEFTIRDSLKCSSMKLWDEEAGKMIKFPKPAELRSWEQQLSNEKVAPRSVEKSKSAKNSTSDTFEAA
jgi:omega-6 fatty acid desaturase (delta-12 desaturase)